MKSKGVALLAVMALLVGACTGSSGAGPAESATAPSESSSGSTAPSAEASMPAVTGVEFAGMVGGPGGMNEIAQGAIDRFNAATGNKMSLVQGTSGESPFQQLAAMYASGSVPAIISVDLADVAKLSDKVADLSNEKWVADANPELIRAGPARPSTCRERKRKASPAVSWAGAEAARPYQISPWTSPSIPSCGRSRYDARRPDIIEP
jgi:ABC-type glycerol-3-phosphate transport system substrate-binding protein